MKSLAQSFCAVLIGAGLAGFLYTLPRDSQAQTPQHGLPAPGTHLYDGLPKQLPIDYLKKRLIDEPKLVQYEPSVKHGQAPVFLLGSIDGSFYVNGFKRNLVSRLTRDRHFVALPKRKYVRDLVVRDSGERYWDFPIGTELLHEIQWNVAPNPELFELRWMKRMSESRWAFGSYYPALDVDRRPILKLREDGQDLPFEYSGEFKESLAIWDRYPNLAEDEKKYGLTRGWEAGRHRIKAKDRPDGDTCLICHMHSVLEKGRDHSADEMLRAGPCSFGPDNEHVNNREWIKEFERTAKRPFFAPKK